MKRLKNPFVKPRVLRVGTAAPKPVMRRPFGFQKRGVPIMLWWIAVASVASGCGATIGHTVTVSDIRGDDHGPGTYTYPDGYVPGSFDLTGVELGLDREGVVVVEVSFARRVPLERGVRLANDLVRDVFLPTVDLYLDLDGTPGSGRRELLAGRNARLAGPSGWELAIVLSPVPTRVAGLLTAPKASTQAVADVWVARKVVVRGNRLIAKIPAERFGPNPLRRFGLAVVVSGTVYNTTFRTEVDAQVRTAFVREVTAEPGRCGRWEEDIDGAPCTFGGCGSCRNHPRILDLIFPAPGHQERSLGRYATGRAAEVPMVYRGMTPPQPQREAVSNVRQRKGNVLTIALSPSADPSMLAPGKLLDALTLTGDVVGTVAVISVVENAVVVRVVDGDPSKVKIVRFTRAGSL